MRRWRKKRRLRRGNGRGKEGNISEGKGDIARHQSKVSLTTPPKEEITTLYSVWSHG